MILNGIQSLDPSVPQIDKVVEILNGMRDRYAAYQADIERHSAANENLIPVEFEAID